MSGSDPRGWKGRRVALGATLGLAVFLSGCAKVEISPHLRPISKDTMMQLGKKQMTPSAPIFVRIFKEESELELWKQRADGRYYLFKTYPICTWSGDLGPKIKQGDKQSPEGFYAVNRHQMNPNSDFHLSFNLGFPNAYDRAHGRTGDFLMVHGKCKSAGCYAMTDALIEEIYALARESFIGGQDQFEVHAFPFRMTEQNLERHRRNPNHAFWRTLKEGYDAFELTRQPPPVAVCERRYVVNVTWRGGRPDPAGPCPRFERPQVEAFQPGSTDQALNEKFEAPGPRTRAVDTIPASVAAATPPSADQMVGLTRAAPGRSQAQ